MSVRENEITNVIVDCAIEVHRTLGGPGLLESVYEEALVWELEHRGLTVKRQVSVPVVYKGRELPQSFRLDLVVNDLVVVECKATSEFNPILKAQALTYLRVTGLKVALVLNFGQKLMKGGIHRVVNNL